MAWVPQGRIKFHADGRTLAGCADTGSDLDFMSLYCAKRRGFKIDRGHKALTCVMMADGTTCSTKGTVHVSSMKLADFNVFDTKFHVLDSLPADVIFGEGFLQRIDAFNTCSEVMECVDPFLNGLNTLINLGPIQTFFSTKWGSKKIEVTKKQGRDAVEERFYRKNKAARSFARVAEEGRESPDDRAQSEERFTGQTGGVPGETEGRKAVVADENCEVGDGDPGGIAKGVGYLEHVLGVLGETVARRTSAMYCKVNNVIA